MCLYVLHLILLTCGLRCGCSKLSYSFKFEFKVGLFPFDFFFFIRYCTCTHHVVYLSYINLFTYFWVLPFFEWWKKETLNYTHTTHGVFEYICLIWCLLACSNAINIIYMVIGVFSSIFGVGASNIWFAFCFYCCVYI